MKKILVISSDPRRDDNSDTLCARFRAGAAEAGHEVAEVCLGDLRIDPCLGCGNCSVEGGVCPLQDDMAPLASKMAASEVVVLDTTPRACAMGGPMKNFIDRSCAYRHEIRVREFCILLAAAGKDAWLAERTLNLLRGFVGSFGSSLLKGAICDAARQPGASGSEQPLLEACELGRSC